MGNEISPRKVYGETLAELGETYPEIVVLDADLSTSTHTYLFERMYPDRFFNMGVAEADMIGTAAGLALTGKMPFISTFAIFAAGRAWEQIRQSIAYPRLNVRIVATHGGITVGEDGASHHCIEDLALMRVIPEFSIIVPADPIETKQVIQFLTTLDGPVYVRLPRIKYPILFDKDYEFEFGKARILREGGDLTIIAVGTMVSMALKAADALASEGVSSRVINMTTLKPIDQQLIISSAQHTGAIVTVEEHSIIGGLGEAVCSTLSKEYPVPVEIVGIKDTFGVSGSGKELLGHYNLLPEDIVKAAKRVLKRK